MRIQPYQRWFAGGALAAVVLLAMAWLLLISPQNARTAALHDQTAAATARLPALQRRLAELQRQNADKQQYLAQLDQDRQALPSTSGMSDFLRELQAAGDNKGVSVTSVMVATPKQVTASGGSYYSLPVTLTAQGWVDSLNAFLDQLQQTQPRAVLINSASISSGLSNGSAQGPTRLTLAMQVFVSATAPAATASARATSAGG